MFMVEKSYMPSPQNFTNGADGDHDIQSLGGRSISTSFSGGVAMTITATHRRKSFAGKQEAARSLIFVNGNAFGHNHNNGL